MHQLPVGKCKYLDPSFGKNSSLYLIYTRLRALFPSLSAMNTDVNKYLSPIYCSDEITCQNKIYSPVAIVKTNSKSTQYQIAYTVHNLQHMNSNPNLKTILFYILTVISKICLHQCNKCYDARILQMGNVSCRIVSDTSLFICKISALAMSMASPSSIWASQNKCSPEMVQ